MHERFFKLRRFTMRNRFILEILARNLDSKPIYRLIACEISNKTDASQMPQLPPAPESPTQLFKQVVRYYIAGRPFTRDKVIQSHSMYRIVSGLYVPIQKRADSNSSLGKHFFPLRYPWCCSEVLWIIQST